MRLKTVSKTRAIEKQSVLTAAAAASMQSRQSLGSAYGGSGA